MSLDMEGLLVIFLYAPVGIRWILHVPSGFVMSAGYYYDLLRDAKGIYGVIPGASDLIDGQMMVGTAGTVLMWWNFGNIALAGFAGYMGAWQIIIGLVDLGITLTIIIGLAMQRALLPATYGGCNASAGDSAFFIAANNTIDSFKAPQAVCREMVWSRAFCIAVVSLYSIVTFANLLVGVCGIVQFLGEYDLRPTWLIEKASPYVQATKRKAAESWSFVADNSHKAKEVLGAGVLVVVSLPSQGVTLVREWRRRRAVANEESMAELAVKDEEELGLIPREEGGEGSKSVDDERVGLMASKDGDDSDSDTSRRWSEDTVTDGQADTRA